ncbi:pantoate--beta-alanine ligase [Rhodobacteraceae bacterium MBR-64]
MKIIRTRADLRAATAAWRQAGESIGVVPTMGALHEGHLSLVTAAKSTADRVIVTLFVNPRQFNNAADLAAYPRTETSDAEKLGPFAVDVLYIPDPDQMYPKGFATTVSVGGLDQGLCGAHRPGHFDGVATVVTKLFIQTDADAAFFGEKDYQQLQIVRTLARDLDLHIRVIGCPTVREADGLALSSRNVRLGSKARADAPGLYRALQAAAARINAGDPVADVIGAARAAILAAGYTEVEYLELRSEDGLEPLTAPRTPARLLVAAWIDGVRLIDNIRL